jgi:ribosome biogenesis protein BRX1
MAKIKGSNSKRKRKQEKAEEPEPEEELSSEEEDGDDQQPSDEDGDHSGSDQDEGVEEEGSDDGEEEVVAPPVTPAFKSDGRYHNKQRCLTLCSRGVTARFRHLMEDMRTLLPHCKKEAKLDPGKADNHGGGMAKAVNDIAEIRGCNTVLFLECRKRMDAYLWVGRTSSGSSPVGPSVKFEVSNIHTMDELRLTGNCMKGSRPILTFDESFGRIDHLRVIKELFTDIFGAPRGHPKTKPFVDRVMGFFYADGKVSSHEDLG